MYIKSEETVEFSGNVFSIEDSQKQVAIKIDAAHAGVINGNFLFYTPKALQTGSSSLNKFYKPLQKKHYDKTLGYIYKSEYVDTNVNSVYYDKITKAKDSKALVQAVNDYVKSKDYSKFSKQGFGVLTANAKLYDKQKIENLEAQDLGTVSIAGDSTQAFCSVCSQMIAECGHKLGQRYDGKTCFGIVADELELDHISFETIPANWETKCLIIKDSQTMGKIELLTEGQVMKLTLVELRDKLLGNIDNVLKELALDEYIEQYKKDSETALNSEFLIAADKLLPTNTPLTIFVAQKLLETLDESEDKEILVQSYGTSFVDLFDGKTEDEVKELLTTGVQTTNLTPENNSEPVVATTTLEPEQTPTVSEPATLQVTDADQVVLKIVDSLNAVIDDKFSTILSQISDIFSKENTAKANKLLEDKIEAFKVDLANVNTFNGQLTEELRQSLLNQVLMLGNVEEGSTYYNNLQTRSIQELKMTIQDHIELFRTNKKVDPAPTTEPTPTSLAVTDSQNNQPTNVTNAVQQMAADPEPTTLVIEDADKIINTIVEGVTSKLTRQEYSKMYKGLVFEHGTDVAKKLHSALKTQNKI